jgi:uroporphyrinogen-III decarboxylase
MFDQTDMAQTKEMVGETLCILGNVPSAVLSSGTHQGVKDYCKKRIHTVGKGGGSLMGNGGMRQSRKMSMLD